MTCAYHELYLDNARKVIAVMLDYVVNSLGLEGDAFFKMFAASGIAKQIEAGNPQYVVGRSGIELAHDVLDAVGLPMDPTSYQSIDRSPEYWLGWALAYYQWSRGVRFSTILQWLSVLDGTRMYRKYHELDIRHFCDRVDELRGEQSPEANLKRLRRMSGYSQRMLAERSGVPLRTIQQYEQQQKNINKAGAETVVALASALGCNYRDLLEITG